MAFGKYFYEAGQKKDTAPTPSANSATKQACNYAEYKIVGMASLAEPSKSGPAAFIKQRLVSTTAASNQSRTGPTATDKTIVTTDKTKIF